MQKKYFILVMTGVLDLIQKFFWEPIQQSINRLVSLRLHDHILRSNVKEIPKKRRCELVHLSLNGGTCIEQIIR